MVRLTVCWEGILRRAGNSLNAYYLFQIGVAVGFLVTPLIVPDVDDLTVIATNLRILFIGTAAFTLSLAVLVAIGKLSPMKSGWQKITHLQYL